MSKVFIEKASYFVATESSPIPDVSFVPMLTRRRLSPLSKLVVYVSNGISARECEKKIAGKTTFASQFGEISQQYKISNLQLETGTISPAHFSQSVFNASIANATILEKNPAGYSATFAGKDAFLNGLTDCTAALEVENFPVRNFIFADERIPEIYAPIVQSPYPNISCALALRLTKEHLENVIALDELIKELRPHQFYKSAAEEALDFIRVLESRT